MHSKSLSSNPPVAKDAQPRALSVEKTPCSYEQGKSLMLLMTKTFSGEIKVSQLGATVIKLHSIMMSPATEIVYKTNPGVTKHGVLKVYDRKFRQSFRKIPGLPGKIYPVHTHAAESSWLRYVRDDKANALFEEIKASYEQVKGTAASTVNRLEKTKIPPSRSSQDKGKGKGTRLDVLHRT